jgi:VWFA-related protein
LGVRQWAWTLVAAGAICALAAGPAIAGVEARQETSSGSAASGSLPPAPQAQQPPSAPQPQTGVPDAPGASGSSALAPGDSNDLKTLANQTPRGKAEAPGEGETVDAQPAPATTPKADGPPQAEPPLIPKGQQETEKFLANPAATPETSTPDTAKPDASATRFVVNTTFIPVPVTVLDKNHAQVAGLTYRDFRIYENGQRQHIAFFSVDPVPLSIAFVIDQSLQKDTMAKVNQSLSALQGALTPQDEVSVFTYADGVQKQTDFTAAEGNRLPQVLERSKKSGSEVGPPTVSGPLAVPGPIINNKPVDPNVNGGNNVGAALQLQIPREAHTLSDAILAAGKELQSRPRERRRVIYVVSDGKDVKSKANMREVVRFLQTNQETVYGTMVGDAATFGIGYLDRFKVPLIPVENVLPRYAAATGGVLEAQFHTDGIETSFARIAKEIRTQYTLGYYSHIPVLDSRYRTLDVHVERPNLEVKARLGYYPTATLQLK